MLMRDFRILGEEKFLPKNETRQLSLFTLQSIDLGKLRAEAGARIEHSIVNADADPDIGNLATSRSFDAISGRSEEHTSELQSLMRISYAVFCLKKKKIQ